MQSLSDDLPAELTPVEEMLAFEVITCDDSSRETEHRSLEAQLGKLLRRHDPELCLYTGQAPPYNKIMVEKIATNSFMRDVIDPARPVAYWSDLPGTDNLRTILEEHDIPAGYSFHGGQHLCNHILYSSLYLADKEGRPHKSGFIHIPVLPEQAIQQHRDSPSMSIDISRRAMSLIINHVVEACRHEQSLQPTAGNRG